MTLKNYHTINTLEAGVDESGVGTLIGRVYAAAVIWPTDFDEDILNSYEYSILRDSKKLSEESRYELKKFIEDNAIDYAIGYCEPQEIDQINILNARIDAMHKALNGLQIIPESLLIDGNYFKKYINNEQNEIDYTLVVKGDDTYQSIAAASILAKCYHDDYIQELHKEFPMYGLNTNHGYGTVAHYKALKEHGPTIHHRMSFNLHLNLIESENEN